MSPFTSRFTSRPVTSNTESFTSPSRLRLSWMAVRSANGFGPTVEMPVLSGGASTMPGREPIATAAFSALRASMRASPIFGSPADRVRNSARATMPSPAMPRPTPSSARSRFPGLADSTVEACGWRASSSPPSTPTGSTTEAS